MVALFQVPRCEVCELGGATAPVFYAVRQPNWDKLGGDYSFGAVFKEKAGALAWAEHIVASRGVPKALVIHAVLAKRCEGRDIPWTTGSGGLLKGFHYADFRLFAAEEATTAHPGDRPLFVVAKP